MSLFVDTSTIYAAADRGDRNNGRAKEVLSRDERYITTDHVLVESWLLVAGRIGREAAEALWGGLRASMAVEPVLAGDLETAYTLGPAFPDQDFSIVDRTSFAVMMRLGIFRAASFDHHFAIFRFGRGRSRALEVLS